MKATSRTSAKQPQDRLPLLPHPEASLECLLARLHPIFDRLLERRFSDMAASQAIDAVLAAGLRKLTSGEAAAMSDKHRAGWLWRVAMNAAKKAAVKESNFVRLEDEPVDYFTEYEEKDKLLEAMRREIPNLAREHRQAIVLHGLKERSFRKAARTIGVASSTVEYRYNEGLNRLALALRAVMQAAREKNADGFGRATSY